MTSVEIRTFSTSPLDRKIDFYSVSEGYFVAADHTPERPFLATMGLFTCKAIAMYSPEAQRGLLAHLSHARMVDLDIERLVRQFGNGFEDAVVQIVQAQQHTDEREWPTADMIATEVTKHSPSSIAIDRNEDGLQIRGVALDLADGKIYELDNEFADELADEWHGSVDFSRNIPIDPLSSIR